MRRILILLVVIAAMPLAAQPADDAGETDKVAAPAAESPAEQPAPARPGNTREESADTADPSSYEASEQISEDLSVSFPVDI